MTSQFDGRASPGKRPEHEARSGPTRGYDNTRWGAPREPVAVVAPLGLISIRLEGVVRE
jgi:hypothetical protein